LLEIQVVTGYGVVVEQALPLSMANNGGWWWDLKEAAFLMHGGVKYASSFLATSPVPFYFGLEV
jgi:hypothetical protein